MDRPNNEENQRDPIEERLIDQRQTGQDEVVDAAAAAFERDQRNDPDHPTRLKRDKGEGVEDPAHSVGSNRQGPGGQDL